MTTFNLKSGITKFFVCFGLLLLSNVTNAQVEKSDFYTALGANNEQTIDAQIAIVQKSAGSDKDAYEGALLMKKAAFANGASKKLSMFKLGNQKLEKAIQSHANNAEYRLLRLMIQEHAPKVLKYNTNMETDGAYIKQNYKSLSPDVQKVVLDYTKQSKVLKPEDFKAETT